MTIIDAYWEKRNLGKSVKEVCIDETDTIENIEEGLKKIDAEYVVLKIPTTRTDLLFKVDVLGLTYVEDMVDLVSTLNLPELNHLQKRIFEQTFVEEIKLENMTQLYIEIEKGIFETDRIAVDPVFSKKIANRRYVNWIKDELERGTRYYVYKYKNKEIGFFSLKEKKDGEYISFIGGMYKECRDGGLGALINHHVINVVRMLKGKKVHISVSTNNVAQMKSAINSGYVPENISHVYIKHAMRMNS